MTSDPSNNGVRHHETLMSALSRPARRHCVALAGLLRARGFAVRGSDLEVYPPASTELERLGVRAVAYRADRLRNLIKVPEIIPWWNVERYA